MDKQPTSQQEQEQGSNGQTGGQPEATAQEEKETYIPDKSEKHLYHVRLEQPFFSQSTGKKLSTPFVQKFTEAEYNALVGKRNKKEKSNADMLGYTVEVLWNPKEHI